jgi:hypothetical protein
MIAAIIDADAVQAQRKESDIKMVYDRNLPTSITGNTIGISAFSGSASDRTPILLCTRFDGGQCTYHISVDDAKGLRDALTEAIAAREAIAGVQ